MGGEGGEEGVCLFRWISAHCVAHRLAGACGVAGVLGRVRDRAGKAKRKEKREGQG